MTSEILTHDDGSIEILVNGERRGHYRNAEIALEHFAFAFAEIDLLREERDKLQRDYDSVPKFEWPEPGTVADAERYRWLRDAESICPDAFTIFEAQECDGMSYGFKLKSGAELDQVVDIARSV